MLTREDKKWLCRLALALMAGTVGGVVRILSGTTSDDDTVWVHKIEALSKE